MSLAPFLKSPDLLARTSVKAFQADLYKHLRRLAKKHNSRETAVPFFMDTQAQMADDASAFFFTFGKIKAWKAHAKKAAAQSLALRGFCYASPDPESKCIAIFLLPVAGKAKAKEALLQKRLKAILPLSKARLHIVAGEFDEDSPEFQALEQAAETAPEEEITELDQAQEALQDELQNLQGPAPQPSRRDLRREVQELKKQGEAIFTALAPLVLDFKKQAKAETVAQIQSLVQRYQSLAKRMPLELQEAFLKSKLGPAYQAALNILSFWAKKQENQAKTSEASKDNQTAAPTNEAKTDENPTNKENPSEEENKNPSHRPERAASLEKIKALFAQADVSFELAQAA